MSTNRLHSLWPSQSSDGKPPALPNAQHLAAKLEPLLENAGHTIAHYPRTSLTAAAVLGIVVGWFVKRH